MWCGVKWSGAVAVGPNYVPCDFLSAHNKRQKVESGPLLASNTPHQQALPLPNEEY